MSKPICDSCNQEMELSKRLQDGTNIKGQKYRRRRYHCDICDIYHTMYCDGQGDKQAVINAVNESKEL